MKVGYKFVALILVCGLILALPPRLKADGPVGFAIVAAVYVATGAIAVGAAVSEMTSEDETTETDEAETTTTDSGGTESEEEGGRGENEGTDGLSGGNKKPVIITEAFARGSWFQSNTTAAIYGAEIPASVDPRGARMSGATRTIPGAGVSYRTMQDKGDILQTPTKIRKITFKRTRSSTLKITRKGAATKALSVPVRIQADELRAETVDVAGTNGNSTSKLSVLVNGNSKFEVSVSVSQAQMPTFSSLPTGATKEERADFGAI